MSDLRPDEQAISQAVEAGLTSQIESAEDIHVEVKTDLLKVVQGEADSVSIAGTGVVLQPDVRVEQMELQTNRLAINPLSVLFGQIKLREPLQAAARMVLTSADLNQAMNSESMQSRMQAIALRVEDQEIPIEMQLPMTVDLSTPGKMGFSGTMLVHYPSGTQSVTFSARICPRQDDRPVLLEAFECKPGQGVSIPLTIAIMQKAQELVQSPYLALEGMILHVKQMTVADQNLIIEGEALLAEIPSV